MKIIHQQVNNSTESKAPLPSIGKRLTKLRADPTNVTNLQNKSEKIKTSQT